MDKTFDYKDITLEEYQQYLKEWQEDKIANIGRTLDIDEWDEGICINIMDGAYLSNPNTTMINGDSFPEWVHELGNHFGERCDEGVLIGFQYSFEDYYYIILKDNGKRMYSSCVGDIEFLTNN